MIDPGSFLLGMLFAFIASAGIVGAIVWYETRRKRLSAYEQFENVSADQRDIAKAYRSPSYHFQKEDVSSGQWSTK